MTPDSTHDGSMTAVMDMEGVQWASSAARVETVLLRRPGVVSVEANPVGQTATVTFDPDETSVEALRDWIEECGFHCVGQSVPEHICDPMAEPAHTEHAKHAEPAEPGDDTALRSPQEAMGHGGHGAMSMAAMVADMRRRFLVAALFSIPIVLWSP